MKSKNANNNQSEASGFVKKLLGFSLSSYICAVITFVASFINTRVYDTASMGKINLFFTAQTFVLYFAYFGLDQSYCRYYYDCDSLDGRKKLYNICVSGSIYITIIASAIILVFWRGVSNYIIGEASALVALSLIVSVFAQVIWRYLTLLERMRHQILSYTVLMILNSLTNKLSFTSTSWISKNVIMSLIVIALSSLLVTLVFYYKKSEHISMISPRQLQKDELSRRSFKFGVPLMPVSLISWLNSSIPILLIREFIDYNSVGVYSNTVVLVSIISLIQSGFNTFWVPYYYENYKDNNHRIMKVHNIICLVMISFAILLIMGKSIIYMLLGDEYRSGAITFALLLVSPVCYTVGETTGIGIGISEKSYLNSIVYCIGACATFIVSFFLIPIMGIQGAGISVAFSSVLTLLLKTIIGERYYRTIESRIKTISAISIMIIAVLVDSIFVDRMIIMRYVGLGLLLCVLLVIYRKELKYCIAVAKNMMGFRNRND